MQSWAYKSAASSAHRCHAGIATFSTEGVIARSDAAAVLANCQDFLDHHASAALVADYRQAQLHIDADALHRSALGVVAHGGALALLPTALLVKPDDLTMWRTYCGLMARSGILRGAFTCAAAADGWIREQAQVYALDQAWRRRQSR